MQFSTPNFLIVALIICGIGPSMTSGQSTAITNENFEQEILNYVAENNSKQTDKQFEHATMILRETKKATKGKPENFNKADYFNVLSAFLTLRESPDRLTMAFNKFLNADGSCEYLTSFSDIVESNKKYDPVRERWMAAKDRCEASGAKIVQEFDIQQYATTNSLDIKLLQLIDDIQEVDGRYRKDSDSAFELQKPLDLKNQRLIDSLFQIYESYIGRSLVGQQYEHVMWSVIQHSNMEMMGKYLSIIHQAFLSDEIGKMPFKMLLDRYYGLKHGYQIFGSQSGFGFELADEETRRKIMSEYGVE